MKSVGKLYKTKGDGCVTHSQTGKHHMLIMFLQGKSIIEVHGSFCYVVADRGECKHTLR